MTKKYITVTDHQGAAFYDGTPVPISHRFYIEAGRAVGAESIIRKFSNANAATQAMIAFTSQPSGQLDSGRFEWRHE